MTALATRVEAPVAFFEPRQPTSSLERAYLSLVIFFLAFNLPHTWLVSYSDQRAAEVGDLLSTAVFIVLLGAPLVRLSGGWRRVGLAMGAFPAYIFFVLVIPASVFWSRAPVITAKRSVGFLLATGLGLYLYARCDPREFILIISRSLLVGAIVNLFWGLSFTFDSAGTWGGVWALKNSLGSVSGFSMIIMILAAGTEPRRRVMYSAGAVLCAFLVYKSTSGTAIVGTLLSAVLLALYNALRSKRTLFGATVVGLAGSMTFAGLAATANLKFLTGLIGKNPTLTGRTVLWERVIQEISHNPILGFGHDAFWGGYGSPAHQIWIEITWKPPSGHNLILDSMLDLGLVGTIPLIILLLQTVLYGVRYVRDHRGAPALFPLIMVTYVLLFSMTETGPVGRTALWASLTYAVAMLGEERAVQTGSDWLTGASPAPKETASLAN